ncbi:hypothetical protein [Streptomyces sp. Ag109_O5-1]|uniref:hypothetical protein n=1 Tax=Streptomyces sp. Ag109_O5-1 TaxID=1938851 RepID=UPI000F4DDC73|nr:hypothetical protein [Streptomyces sp. Ag109_O5-1]
MVPRAGSPVVVELGPGTGAFTHALQRRLAGRGRYIAVEVNPRFAQRLAALPPAVEVVDANATDLAVVLAQRGLSQTDVVVSGLLDLEFDDRELAASKVGTGESDELAHGAGDRGDQFGEVARSSPGGGCPLPPPP